MDILDLARGTRLSWQEYGNPDSYPVIYFHGLPGSHAEPESATSAANETGVRLIAIDRFGYGESVSASDCGLLQFCGVVSQFADALNLCNYSVLGFSGGASYALACASTLGDQINRVAIISPTADFSTQVMQEHYSPDFKPLFELAAADPSLAKQQLEQVAQSTEAVMQLMQTNLPPDDQRIFSLPSFQSSYSKNITTALNQCVTGTVNDMHHLGSPWPFDIRSIRVPTTIWHGSADRNCGVAIANYFNENIPDTRLHILQGKGHFFIFEYWQEVLSELVNGVIE